MGERQDDRGAADGRRRCVHPGATASGAPAPGDVTGLEELLAVVLRAPGTGPAGGSEGEQRAVAAFRAARDAGAHSARTRRRDDWRQQGQRRARRSLRATLTVAVASLALGGVAVAAIGTVRSSTDDGSGGARPATRSSAPPAASGGPSTADPAAPAPAPALPAGPAATAEDTAARCLAYEKAGGRSGEAMATTAWQRLVAAAGGEDQVTAYCAHVTATASPADGTTRGNTTPGTARATARPDGAGGSPGAAASNATQGQGQDDGQGDGRTDGQTDGQSNGAKTGGGKGS
ncbi:hypothetical protein ACF081_04380 [Streptomyces longwoodensis]|uniref:hypothetical protein n=1 Tax=Streptomyces longwoodensis TaxID=68231 RepID=UPI003700A3A4